MMYGDDPKTEQLGHLNNVLIIGLLAAAAWWGLPKVGRKYGTGKHQ